METEQLGIRMSKVLINRLKNVEKQFGVKKEDFIRVTVAKELEQWKS